MVQHSHGSGNLHNPLLLRTADSRLVPGRREAHPSLAGNVPVVHTLSHSHRPHQPPDEADAGAHDSRRQQHRTHRRSHHRHMARRLRLRRMGCSVADHSPLGSQKHRLVGYDIMAAAVELLLDGIEVVLLRRHGFKECKNTNESKR